MDQDYVQYGCWSRQLCWSSCGHHYWRDCVRQQLKRGRGCRLTTTNNGKLINWSGRLYLCQLFNGNFQGLVEIIRKITIFCGDNKVSSFVQQCFAWRFCFWKRKLITLLAAASSPSWNPFKEFREEDRPPFFFLYLKPFILSLGKFFWLANSLTVCQRIKTIFTIRAIRYRNN